MAKIPKKLGVAYESIFHLGAIYAYIEPYLRSLGLDVVVPPFSSRRTLDLGTRFCPEMICVPCKLIFGNYVEALEGGADTLIMFGGQGTCRLGYSARQQEQFLRHTTPRPLSAKVAPTCVRWCKSE
jgi:predicted nucleotide-binding protein (sugar kinase/HSP70/actin superfamily)